MLAKNSNSAFLSILGGCLTALSVFCLSTPPFAGAADNLEAVAHDPATAVEKLVREFYPKAIINKGRSEIEFSYKAHKKNGFYPDRPAMVPADGGIVGTVTLSPGEYDGPDKSTIPSEKPNGFYEVLTMAPYSKRQNSHLLARVIFPEDGSSAFKERFKNLMNAFNASDKPVPEATKVEPAVETASTSAAAPEAPVKSAPTYAWATVVRPESRISFRFPQGGKSTVSPDKATTTWKGNADGVDYQVTVHQPTAASITDEQRKQAMSKLISMVSLGKKPKLEQDFNFQGLTAQEYTLADAGGNPSKAIVCVSAGLQYLFFAGGKNYKVSKLPPEFFDGVKIGKVK